MSTPPVEKFIGHIPVYDFKNPNPRQFLDALFDATAAAGLNSVRFAFFWSYDAVHHTYGLNQDEIALVMEEVRRKGFRVWGIVNPPNQPSTAGWTPPDISPDLRNTFLELVKYLGYAHGNLIESWEILNEANQAFDDGKGGGTPYYEGAAFASLLRDSYKALLSGFQEREDYVQLVQQRGGAAFKLYPAGTAGTDITWIEAVCVGLEALYNAYPNEGKYINGFSIHPFSAPKGPDDYDEFKTVGAPHDLASRGSLAANIDWASFALAKHPKVPNDLFIGEYGWSTSSPANPSQAVAEEAQARYVAQGFIEAHACGRLAQAIWAWTFHDLANVWAFWDHTGALREDGGQKPSYLAIKNVVDRLRGMLSLQNLSWILPDGRMFLYRNGSTTTIVYWCTADTQLNVHVGAGATSKVYDMLGNVVQTWPTNTTTLLPFTAIAPHYLEVTGASIASIQGAPLNASGAPDLPGLTRLSVGSASASSTLSGSAPSFAFDNNPATSWSAGAFPEAWVEAAFSGPQTIGGVLLVVAQTPAGNTKHQLEMRIDNGGYQALHLFSGHTAEGMRLVCKLPTPIQHVTHIRVRTTNSPSWVAWHDIGTYKP